MEQKNQVELRKNICDEVLAKVNTFQSAGELKIPSDYSPENALKSAFLILSETTDKDGNSVLETCSKPSIANALLKMVTEGLSPMKRQGSFIAYGGKLSFQREYAGTLALAKRYGDIIDVVPNVVYENDIFEYHVDSETGLKTLIKHEQKIENIDINKIKGAYAVVWRADGRKDLEVMTIAQIRNAWQQGFGKGNTVARNKFTDEMCCKTVINRACKPYINSSNDESVLGGQTEPNQTQVVEENEVIDIPVEVIKEQPIEEKEEPTAEQPKLNFK